MSKKIIAMQALTCGGRETIAHCKPPVEAKIKIMPISEWQNIKLILYMAPKA